MSGAALDLKSPAFTFEPAWLADVLNTLGRTSIAVRAVAAPVLDNTIPRTDEERGLTARRQPELINARTRAADDGTGLEALGSLFLLRGGARALGTGSAQMNHRYRPTPPPDPLAMIFRPPSDSGTSCLLD